MDWQLKFIPKDDFKGIQKDDCKGVPIVKVDDRIMIETVDGFQRIIDEEVEQFVEASTSFGSQVMATMAALVKDSFEAELAFIRQAVACEKPSKEEYTRMTDPIFKTVLKINSDGLEYWKAKEFVNHLTTVSNAIQALNWISVPKTPLQFIKDMKEAGDYYGNRVLTANKGNDLHITWVNKWNAIMTALEDYVRKYHLTGFTWNLTGGSAQGPPPPPPPPLPPATRERLDYHCTGDATNPPAADSPELRADRAALMVELNQGVDIRRMLRHVNRRDDSPPLYDFPEVRPDPRVEARRNAPPPAVHPPVFILEGKKWRVEYQENENLEVNPENKSESLAMFRCQGTTIRSTAKMNAVTIDNCKKCIIILSHIISSVELIRCERVQVQCDGSCPNITLDNCDSVQIFLYDNSAACEVISSKSTSTNICRASANGDYVEFPVPEQIKSVLVNNKLQSSVVEHCM